MPKIPTYTTQGRPTAEVGSIKSNVQMPLTTALTSVQSAVADYYVAEKKEEAKLKSAEYENESWNELYGIYDKYKNNPYPTDASNGFLKDVQTYKQNFLNTTLANESNFTKKAWLSRFDSNTGSTLVALNKASRSKLDEKEEEEFDKFGSSLSTRIRLDNSFLATADSEIDNYVSKYTDKFVKEEKRKNLFKVKNATILDKQSRIDPVGLLNQLKKNPDLYSNVPEEKEKAIIRSQNTIKDMNENYFQESVNSVVVNTPFGQLADTSSLFDSSIEKLFTDPKDQAKAKTAIETAFEQKMNVITKDGGAEYFINNDPKINEFYNQSLNDSNDFKAYVQILDKTYNEQKVPDNYRTYLPTDKITEINKSIKGTPGATEKLNIINSLKRLYGDKMPIVNKQLDKQADPGIAMAISTNSKTLQSLSVLGPLTEDNKKIVSSRFGTKTETDLLKKIESNLSGLADVVSNQPEGYKRYSSYIAKNATALKNAAMNGLLEETYSSIQDAADGVSEQFLNDYNITEDTFYIPYDVNGKVVAQGLLEAKSEMFKTRLYYDSSSFESFNVDVIGSGGTASSKKETIDFFRKNGEWYMDGNTGIKFGVKESFGGFTPMTVDGKNVTINFLDFDGEFSSMKDVNGESYIINMKDINAFIDAQYMGQQTP
tara:strand:+ start:571 stop:2541 length:1971 start_codon:yes stop_codon:yes gene_type:complete